MSLGNSIFKGFIWSAFERISVQAVQFILGIILARILSPKEYGLIGILLVFIVVSQVFVQSGFTKALIQKQDRSERDISTVFFFNVSVSLVCYILLWFLSPLVALFYDEPILIDLLRVLALTIVISAFYTVPNTLITIKLNFRLLTKINVLASIFSGGIAVYLAYTGYGVWALVAQTILRGLFTMLFMWMATKWKPHWIFSFVSLRTMFKYGSNLLVSSLLNVTVNNFYSLFIAKLSSTKDLGFYTRGTQFADVGFNIINSSLENVLLPGLSTIQDRKDDLVSKIRNIIKISSLLIVPIFIHLVTISEPLIILLLTEKWSNSIPIMQFLCIARLITIISGININLLYVIGRTDLALRQQYLKIIIRIILLLAALKYGIVAIALAELISTSIHFFINTYYPGKIMQYGALSQIKDIRYILLSSLIMGFTSYWIMNLFGTDIEKIIFATCSALVLYSLLIFLFERNTIKLLTDYFKNLINKKIDD